MIYYSFRLQTTHGMYVSVYVRGVRRRFTKLPSISTVTKHGTNLHQPQKVRSHSSTRLIKQQENSCLNVSKTYDKHPAKVFSPAMLQYYFSNKTMAHKHLSVFFSTFSQFVAKKKQEHQKHIFYFSLLKRLIILATTTVCIAV